MDSSVLYVLLHNFQISIALSGVKTKSEFFHYWI